MVQGKPQARGMARRQAMLDAATALFLEKGFEGTSLSDIVERSKGSRSTLYEQFGNKEGLLRAMIESASDRIWQMIDFDKAEPALSESGLIDMGTRFVRASLACDAIAIFRIVVAEGPRVPGIAQFFYEKGPIVVKARLTEWFAKARETGDFGRDGETGTPEDMARVFLGCVAGDFYFLRALGVGAVADDKEIERYVNVAVRIFLGGLARAEP